MPGHTKCCTCHAKSSSQTWRSDAPKCNPSQEINALTSEQLWWTCLLYCACHAKDILPDPLHMSHACHRFRQCHKTLTFCALLTRCIIPCACHAKRHLNVQKCSEPVSFYTFDFEMCFAPQRCALFRHLNFQKWSEHGVLSAFLLGNVLRATTACNFSSLISPHGSTPAALASLLFDPPEPQIIGKTQCFAAFPPFRAPASSFFWLCLFPWLFPPLLFHLSILSEVWLLNFLP